jgi:hypothetical protein
MEGKKRLVAQHYEACWGEPLAIHQIDWPPELGLGDSFYIMEFSPNPVHDAWTYATVGMADHLMPGRFPEALGDPPQRRVEIVAYSNPQRKDLIEFLGHLAVFPFDNRTAIWAGHTIPGDTAVVPGSPMTCVYFSFPLFEGAEFQPICLDGDHVFVLWAIPIYEVERQYKVKHGSKALARLLEERDAEVWNLQREPVV